MTLIKVRVITLYGFLCINQKIGEHLMFQTTDRLCKKATSSPFFSIQWMASLSSFTAPNTFHFLFDCLYFNFSVTISVLHTPRAISCSCLERRKGKTTKKDRGRHKLCVCVRKRNEMEEDETIHPLVCLVERFTSQFHIETFYWSEILFVSRDKTREEKQSVFTCT